MAPLALRSLRATPILDLATYLLGTWDLEREILHRCGLRLNLHGLAEVVEEHSGVLSYFEHASLDSEDGALEFTRRYEFVIAGPRRARVQFADGSFFHDLDLGVGRCRAVHDCDPDRYLGLYLATRNGLLTRWRCSGPEKDYVATTRLTPGLPAVRPDSLA